MDIVISARKVNLRDNFKERVSKKLSKFDKIFSPSAQARVTVTVNKNNQTVEVTIRDGGMIYRSEATCAQMNDALDKVVSNLGRQIRKNKTKLEKKIKSGSLNDFLIDEDFNTDSSDSPLESYDVVRIKNFTVKPMSIDEAILQMNMLGHSFFMFKDIDTDEIRVVYTRKGDTYGLLSPIE